MSPARRIELCCFSRSGADPVMIVPLRRPHRLLFLLEREAVVAPAAKVDGSAASGSCKASLLVAGVPCYGNLDPKKIYQDKFVG